MIAKSVPANKLKSTLDCVDGYHGIELAEEDRHKTTFSTEWGLYRYRRAPQGYLSSGNSYGKYTDAIMEDYPSTLDIRDWEKIVDDVITWAETVEEAFTRICSILSHCNKHLANIDNKRLARLKVKTNRWKFTTVYNPGKSQQVADAISRCKPLHNMYVSMMEQMGVRRMRRSCWR
jgi:hypothetical protein